MKTSHCLINVIGVLYVAAIGATGCSGESSSEGCTTSDSGSGSCASGGSSSTVVAGTTGGIVTTGGRTSTGGVTSAGGATGTGGASTSGGTGTAGGASSSAGTNATTGGISAVGGSAPAGGVPGTGGSMTSGAGTSSAGNAATGGTTSAGGSVATGGVTPVGGSGTVGGGSALGGTTNFQTCQLVPQSGCPGQACDLDLTHLTVAGTVCRPVTTAGTELNTCTSMNDCAAGYLCLNSECVRYCQSDANCDAPGGLCVVTLFADGTTPIPGVTLCSQNCNPLTATGCPSGQGCGVYSTADGLRRYTSCHAASTGTQGATCTNDLDCAPGFGCINFTTNGTTTVQCMQLCQPTVTVCPGTMSCLAFNPPVTLGANTFGICH